MDDQLNSLNSIESPKKLSKTQRFIENTKRAVRDTLIKTGIVASTMGPMATTTAYANGTELTKPKIEIDDSHGTVTDPNHYTSYPGTTDAIFSIMGNDGNTAEVTVDKPQEYKAINITNINPEDLMPKVEVGDKNVYKHIEHLRIPESTKIIDMMREYGAGNYSAEEYKQLMMRLNTGMMGENPTGYDNYEAVGGTPTKAPSNHAHSERFTLNMLIKHANFKIINPPSKDMYDVLYNLCIQDPNKINIMGISIDSDVDREIYDSRNIETIKQYDKEKNRLIFCAGGNIRSKSDGTITNKVYQENYPLPDKHSVYSSISRAHNKNDNIIDRHLIATFGTNKDGDIDQTNEESESSKFPVGFHNEVIFSGRAFPRRRYDGDKIGGETGKYATSHTNYVNVAIADLCFQMKADIADVDELLEMIKSTAVTDYIRFDLNGDGDTDDTYDGQVETQPLMLMNPAGFFQKYLMPTALPTNIKTNETINLEKGYYHGVIYQIPGAEVNINGQWIAFSDENKDLILAQNPMTLKWRLNGELLNNYNYKPGDIINGQIIVVDDMWNGLNITKDFSFNIDDANSIDTINATIPSDARYTIDGLRLNTKPTKAGIYIVNGKKVIIK